MSIVNLEDETSVVDFPEVNTPLEGTGDLGLACRVCEASLGKDKVMGDEGISVSRSI